jgi:hypothetical protein
MRSERARSHDKVINPDEKVDVATVTQAILEQPMMCKPTDEPELSDHMNTHSLQMWFNTASLDHKDTTCPYRQNSRNIKEFNRLGFLIYKDSYPDWGKCLTLPLIRGTKIGDFTGQYIADEESGGKRNWTWRLPKVNTPEVEQKEASPAKELTEE